MKSPNTGSWYCLSSVGLFSHCCSLHTSPQHRFSRFLKIPGTGYYKTVQSRDIKVMHTHTPHTHLVKTTSKPQPHVGEARAAFYLRAVCPSLTRPGLSEGAAEPAARSVRGTGTAAASQPALGAGNGAGGTRRMDGRRDEGRVAAACEGERGRQPHAKPSVAVSGKAQERGEPPPLPAR